MYYYIYDIFTNEKKYEKQLGKIELDLANLGISGKVYKLNVLKNLKNIIEEATDNGVKNIIAVGNDQTVSKIANLMVGEDMAIGIIPVGEPNLLANALGINSAEEAGKIISARKIARLDVGKINGQYFLLAVEPPTHNIIFEFKDYNIKPRGDNEAVGIYNINIDSKNFKSNPEDGVMEAVFVPKQKGWWQKLLGSKNKQSIEALSVFPVKKLTIKHKKKPVMVNIDRQRTLKTPLEIGILPRKLEVIVGKERAFD